VQILSLQIKAELFNLKFNMMQSVRGTHVHQTSHSKKNGEKDDILSLQALGEDFKLFARGLQFMSRPCIIRLGLGINPEIPSC